MRLGLVALLLAVGCRPPVGPEPAPAPAPNVALKTPSEPEPEPTPEPEPEPTVVFVNDGWVRDANDPAAPLLRLTTVRPSEPSLDTTLRVLLDEVDPILRCYETELAADPETRVTLRVRRHGPDQREADPSIEATAQHPVALAECVAPQLRPALAAVTDDPHGLYVIDLYPHRDRAPALHLPDPEDEVIERAGGSCWTLRTFPCAPHKHCMAPKWERTQCRHPADQPGVALRWAFGPAKDRFWPRVGLELVAPDGAVVWSSPLDPTDAERLGAMLAEDAQRHLDEFRDRELPGTWWQAIERDRVIVADRAGVREYDRRSGTLDFHYVPPEHERGQGIWFDDGKFEAVRRAKRCKGDARHGAFVSRCGDDLLYFDGYTLAVVSVIGPVFLHDQTNLDAPTSRISGGNVRRTASLRTGGYRVQIETIVYLVE